MIIVDVFFVGFEGDHKMTIVDVIFVGFEGDLR